MTSLNNDIMIMRNNHPNWIKTQTYVMYVDLTNIFSTSKGVLISVIHCIRHADYENMPDIKTLYTFPNDVFITRIYCIGLNISKV